MKMIQMMFFQKHSESSVLWKAMVLTALFTIHYSLFTASAQKGNVPLVYEVENTGSKFAAPAMPGIDKLPEIRQLPDAMAWSNGKGKVKSFKDWSRRRSEIAHQIQHYGIGTKPTVDPSAVKARMSGDTLIVDVTVNGRHSR